jgi:hypothetical protein
MDSPPTLHYAPDPAPTVRWRRRGIRVILLGGFLAILWFWGGAAWKWVNFLYWEHRCLNYSLPADHIVFQTHAFQVLRAEKPRPWAKLEGDGSLVVWGEAIIFVHEMRQPDGARVLVALGTHHGVQDLGVHGFWLSSIELTIDGILKPPQWEWRNAEFPVFTEENDWKFFAGQPDPVNPSHFTFDFEHNGQRHTADAWLDNAGKLLVSVRP